ncbi:hypothetical protein NEQG_00584 [Nematocida parisii ERTm3]|uniref:Uncharacterized protein n=1 Tax=Nematocida parisii (strain ERTm3) TaxID=935791 RepID=I3EHR8_NEMP3|nr:hypothetical protein NEQG_00584 [Nematocida parisii ERTm3]
MLFSRSVSIKSICSIVISLMHTQKFNMSSSKFTYFSLTYCIFSLSKLGRLRSKLLLVFKIVSLPKDNSFRLLKSFNRFNALVQAVVFDIVSFLKK